MVQTLLEHDERNGTMMEVLTQVSGGDPWLV